MALPFTTPTSLSTSFAMSRPKHSDIDDMCDVYYESFKLDVGNTFWWPREKVPMYEWMRSRIRRKMADPSVRHFQVTDKEHSDELVAFARWDIPTGFERQFGDWVSPEGEVDVTELVAEMEEHSSQGKGDDDDAAVASSVNVAPVEESDPKEVKKLDFPEGADPSLCLGFFSVLSEMSSKWGADDMLGLSLLCTAPKYHRRGAAKALLAPMFAIADQFGLRSYLEATSTGRPVYEKLGFETVEEKYFDLTALTGGRLKGVFTLYIMIREPQQL